LPIEIACCMLGFKVSLASAILTFVLFAGGIGVETIFAQENETENDTLGNTSSIFPEDQAGMPNRDTVFDLYYACLTVNTNKELHPDYKDTEEKGLIDKFVDNGTVSAFYKGWSCKKVGKVLDDIDNLKKSMHDAFTLDKMLHP
jgi:hypothetical protein